MRHPTPAVLLTVALSLLSAPLAAKAQGSGRVPRIGLLLPTSPPPESSRPAEAFRRGLRDLGYVEGQTIALEWRFLQGKVERARAVAHDLVRLRVDAIVTSGTPVIRAVNQATGTIPIVMASSFDPVGAGLVTSLARPGGNVTGMALMATEVVGKRVELLREAEVAARALRIELQVLRARDPGEFDSAFAAMTRERMSAALVIEHPAFSPHRARLAELAVRHRLPTVHGLREFVEAGGLMSYGANLEAMFQRAATYVDKILKGSKPGDLPVEQPTKFELVINLKTAKALGLVDID